MQYYLPITQPFISFHWLLVWTGRTQKGFINNHQFFKVALLALTIYNARDTFNSFIRWFKKGIFPAGRRERKETYEILLHRCACLGWSNLVLVIYRGTNNKTPLYTIVTKIHRSRTILKQNREIARLLSITFDPLSTVPIFSLPDYLWPIPGQIWVPGAYSLRHIACITCHLMAVPILINTYWSS